MHLEYLTSDTAESAEEIIIAKETEKERDALLDRFPELMARLTDEEHKLIYALYFEGVSIREYARITGVRLFAVQKRRDRILDKLKNFLS